jgi:phosphoglycerate dehydrogenase-like enzyme
MSAPQLLYEKTLGIIGMGEIGLAVAQRAKGFGMKVVYSDVRRLPVSYEEDVGARYVRFETLLREADYITLHTPQTKETEKMIGAHELSLMKKNAFLINCSRGGVVDEEALYTALKKNSIGGAGLDVFLMEPVPKNSPILGLKNVVLTPHCASNAGLASGDFERLCSNILRVANGEKPLGMVN